MAGGLLDPGGAADGEVLERSTGIAAAGEGPDTYPFVVDLRGPDQFRKLARLLAERGYTPRRVDKILGGNFMRFAETVWGG